MRDYIQGFYARDAMTLRDWYLADDAGHPDGPDPVPYPTAQEMDRAFRAAARALPPLFCVACGREEAPGWEVNAHGFCPRCCGCGNCIEGQHHPCPARD